MSEIDHELIQKDRSLRLALGDLFGSEGTRKYLHTLKFLPIAASILLSVFLGSLNKNDQSGISDYFDNDVDISKRITGIFIQNQWSLDPFDSQSLGIYDSVKTLEERGYSFLSSGDPTKYVDGDIDQVVIKDLNGNQTIMHFVLGIGYYLGNTQATLAPGSGMNFVEANLGNSVIQLRDNNELAELGTILSRHITSNLSANLSLEKPEENILTYPEITGDQVSFPVAVCNVRAHVSYNMNNYDGNPDNLVDQDINSMVTITMISPDQEEGMTVVFIGVNARGNRPSLSITHRIVNPDGTYQDTMLTAPDSLFGFLNSVQDICELPEDLSHAALRTG